MALDYWVKKEMARIPYCRYFKEAEEIETEALGRQ